jgi:pyruvate/2-oxoglutarate dehydrogenase complex dihydrolipoamide acyltransferase (E2) component
MGLGAAAVAAAGYVAYKAWGSGSTEAEPETEVVKAETPEKTTSASAVVVAPKKEEATAAAAATAAPTESKAAPAAKAAPKKATAPKANKKASPKKAKPKPATPKPNRTGWCVKSPYGQGYIVEDTRADGLTVVRLDFDGFQCNSYLNEDAFTVVSVAEQYPTGTSVTIQGLVSAKKYNGLHGVVTNHEESVHRVVVELAGSSKPLSLKPGNLSPYSQPEKVAEPAAAEPPAAEPAPAAESKEDLVGFLANTPYGPGVVTAQREDGMYEVKLDFDGTPYTGYITKEAVLNSLVGKQICSPYGVGKIIEERKDGLFVCELDFDGSPYKAYLTRDAINGRMPSTAD